MAAVRRICSSKDGRVTTLSLEYYKIPTARDLPLRKTSLVTGATLGPGPFTAKPAAEPAITPIPPAIENAVHNCDRRAPDDSSPVGGKSLIDTLGQQQRRS